VDLVPSKLNRFVRGPLQGAAVLLYVIFLPALIDQRWRLSNVTPYGPIERALLITLAVFWLGIILTLALTVVQLRRGQHLRRSGFVWIAGLLLSWFTLVMPGVASAATQPSSAPQVQQHQLGAPALALPFLLAAKRQRDHSLKPVDDEVVDQVIAERQAVDLAPLRRLHHFFAAGTAGITMVPADFDQWSDVDDEDPVVVCRVGEQNGMTVLGYARPGAALPVPSQWSANQLVDKLVGLPDNRLVFASDEGSLLRALATRQRRTTVVYTGNPADIDDELRALCISLRHDASGEPTPPDPVTVSVLRPVPIVVGLAEPFASTLRRRCVEMVAYLSVHDDPVSGERLRTRVLAHAEVDASKGTLANTATAIRRSLGSDEHGSLLHPVTAAGLYQLHGVKCDLTSFHRYVDQGRRQQSSAAAASYQRALELVRGEPLSSVTKGYDWFVLEGHRGRMQRDGEWAALALYDYALSVGNVDRAFWSLERGLLLDPENELLRETLAEVPRLRQFRGNGAGPAKHHAVSPRGAVAMSGTVLGLGDEIGQ